MTTATSILAKAMRVLGLSSRRPQSLSAIRPDQVWGASEVIEGDPPWGVYENVVWLNKIWALYDEHGDIIAPSALRTLGEAQFLNAPPHIDFDPSDFDVVEEPVLHGGVLQPHFGHMLCSGLSRAWAFQRWPDLRIVFHDHRQLTFEAAMATKLGGFSLPKLGVTAGRAFTPARRTLFRKMLIPGSAFDEQWRGYGAHRRMALALGQGCGAPNGGPLYLSKTRLRPTPEGGVNRIVNELELEAALSRRGVEIVYPEALEMERQIGLFASGRTIVGLTGSALHTHIFAPAAGRIIGVQATAPMISNQLILDRLAGREARYVLPTGATMEGQAGADGFSRNLKLADPEGVARDLLKML